MSDRRQRVLGAARGLFQQYGPTKTTINDIANAAGIGVGSVYLEFANKDAILAALSQVGYESILVAMRDAWTSPGPHAERLRRCLDARFEAFEALIAHTIHGSDLLHCERCDAIQAAQAEFRMAELSLFTAIITEGVEARAFRTRDAECAARGLLLAYHAFSPPAVFMCRKRDLRQELELVHKIVFDGLVTINK